MPMHDWTKATAGTYHDFHLKWIAAITDQLNAELLPPNLFAMAEQIIGGPAPDVVTLSDWPDAPTSGMLPTGEMANGGVATLAEPQAPPQADATVAAGPAYARKKSQIVIKHELGHVLSVIELVSPGNKHSTSAVQQFARKSAELVEDGIHLLVVDPFPPSPRDPLGMANVIWDQIDLTVDLPHSTERTLSAVAFQAKPDILAHVYSFAVGQPLPAVPVFLIEDRYVTLPLEESYSKVWSALPTPIRRIFEA